MDLCIFAQGYFSRGGGEEGGWSQVTPKIEGGLLLKGGMTDLECFLLGGGGRAR